MKILFLLLILFLISCSTTEHKNQIYSPQSSGDGATQLTFIGENSEPTFSPDGMKIIYQSKKRPSHENSQIYILDILTKIEKRTTHNDGDDTCPSYSPDGKRIIYSSTTDEIKERAEELAKEPSKLLPYEVYTSDTDGSRIKRITHHPGYDAEARFSPLGGKIIFTSFKKNLLSVYTMTNEGKGIQKYTNAKLIESGPVYSLSGKKVAWVADGHIFTAFTNGTGQKQITQGKPNNNFPFWHPDGKKIIFSSNREDKNNYDLYLISTDGQCLKRLTATEESETFPSFSNDGKKITYAGLKKNQSQIYIINFSEPVECLKP